ncbi:hypothetical protein RSAG8_13779, partial [Rhizoctonia solani AG-8 WAC10335]
MISPVCPNYLGHTTNTKVHTFIDLQDSRLMICERGYTDVPSVEPKLAQGYLNRVNTAQPAVGFRLRGSTERIHIN